MRPAWPGSSATPSASAPNHGCAAEAGVSTVSTMPALLPPFSGPRSTGSATPSQRHITPKVWQMPISAASGWACTASKSANSGDSHAGDSTMPWLPSPPSFCAGIDVAGPAGAEIEAAAPVGQAAGRRSRAARRTTRRGRAGRRAASASARSQAAVRTAMTMASWPMFGQPWFMSSTKTSTRAGVGRRQLAPACRPGRRRRRRASTAWQAAGQTSGPKVRR